ncbi:hypothetical protein BU17DRAFT_82461 [Hysterangium stoloniferum]|nr:hypothetical protein BU17DRAFT_82461 [Hysterangium stoloniferum]
MSYFDETISQDSPPDIGSHVLKSFDNLENPNGVSNADQFPHHNHHHPSVTDSDFQVAGQPEPPLNLFPNPNTGHISQIAEHPESFFHEVPNAINQRDPIVDQAIQSTLIPKSDFGVARVTYGSDCSWTDGLASGYYDHSTTSIDGPVVIGTSQSSINSGMQSFEQPNVSFGPLARTDEAILANRPDIQTAVEGNGAVPADTHHYVPTTYIEGTSFASSSQQANQSYHSTFGIADNPQGSSNFYQMITPVSVSQPCYATSASAVETVDATAPSTNLIQPAAQFHDLNLPITYNIRRDQWNFPSSHHTQASNPPITDNQHQYTSEEQFHRIRTILAPRARRLRRGNQDELQVAIADLRRSRRGNRIQHTHPNPHDQAGLSQDNLHHTGAQSVPGPQLRIPNSNCPGSSGTGQRLPQNLNQELSYDNGGAQQMDTPSLNRGPVQYFRDRHWSDFSGVIQGSGQSMSAAELYAGDSSSFTDESSFPTPTNRINPPSIELNINQATDRTTFEGMGELDACPSIPNTRISHIVMPPAVADSSSSKQTYKKAKEPRMRGRRTKPPEKTSQDEGAYSAKIPSDEPPLKRKRTRRSQDYIQLQTGHCTVIHVAGTKDKTRVREQDEVCNGGDSNKPWRHFLSHAYEEADAIRRGALTHSRATLVTCQKKLDYLLKISTGCPVPDCPKAAGSHENEIGYYREDSLKRHIMAKHRDPPEELERLVNEASRNFCLTERQYTQYPDWYDKVIFELFEIHGSADADHLERVDEDRVENDDEDHVENGDEDHVQTGD